METTLIFLLSAFSLGAAAQNRIHSETKQSINDDGKTLTISINGNKNEKEFHYEKKFAVAGMSKAQKDALVKRVTDSLGVYHRSTK